MKASQIILRLSRVSALPFVVREDADYIGFGNRQEAAHLSRSDAARILRRVRTWMPRNYYKLEVSK